MPCTTLAAAADAPLRLQQREERRWSHTGQHFCQGPKEMPLSACLSPPSIINRTSPWPMRTRSCAHVARNAVLACR